MCACSDSAPAKATNVLEQRPGPSRPGRHAAMSAIRCTLTCPAKINLALSVGSADGSGLHPIASWMVPIDFFDHLTVVAGSESAKRLDIRFAHDAPRTQEIDWPLEKDLAFRAMYAMRNATGETREASIHLSKRIPTGTGLGGGSSNGAGTLWALKHLFAPNLGLEDLMAIAGTLGSDVMFALHACARGGGALVEGYGEKIEAGHGPATTHMVLFLPDIHCATTTVYKAFDASAPSQPRPADPDRVRALARADRILPDTLFNDLAEAACRVEPQLGEVRSMLRHLAQRPIHVTGSGSAMFALTDCPAEARELASRVRRTTGIAAIAARTLSDILLPEQSSRR